MGTGIELPERLNGRIEKPTRRLMDAAAETETLQQLEGWIIENTRGIQTRQGRRRPVKAEDTFQPIDLGKRLPGKVLSVRMIEGDCYPGPQT